MVETVRETNLPLRLYARGKVRDTYDLEDRLLMVTSDRMSAFDVVMNEPIPYKGIVLNEISLFWFDFTKDIVPNHLISTEVPEEVEDYESMLARRIMVVKKAKPLPVECIVRGYLAGSGWKDYQKTGAVSGIKLPEGLKQADKLPEPIFTPSTKATVGHDENITEEQAAEKVGSEMYENVKKTALAVYKKAADYAAGKGIIIADTKMEFGLYGEKLLLIDEVLTPDSSRFWPADKYEVGTSPPSFDKQFLRDYLETLDWGKKYPAPSLPENIIQGTTERYIDAFEKLTGKKFER